MNSGQAEHTFVICAYKESSYLSECIESLVKQSIKSSIICTTSTPNNHIKDECLKNNIALFVNPEGRGLAADWNFAYEQAKTPYVTLVHQDDIYEPDFLKTTLEYLQKAKNPLIAFSDYYEIRDNIKVDKNRLLRIKRFMSMPWRLRIFQRSRTIARCIFMFGDPICCPSVTFVKHNLPKDALFNEEYVVACDWITWLEIRDLTGEFVYCKKRLVGHRIHTESETTNRIADNTRGDEEYAILQMLSPKPIAKAIRCLYFRGHKSNRL